MRYLVKAWGSKERADLEAVYDKMDGVLKELHQHYQFTSVSLLVEEPARLNEHDLPGIIDDKSFVYLRID